ncbi:MAG TPA: helix-turn-helix domain-containing protein [Clostridiaceae bacterium]|nr:helix-turn-helix domain-containing protein [Clostridiaceae bacterium]
MAYDVAKLGVRIAQMRKERNLTPEALSQKLGVSPQAVSKWETGIGCPDIALLPAIAEALGVTINDLFSDDVAPVEPMTSNDFSFPAKYGSLKFIAGLKNRACYADTNGKTDGSIVRFEDGSEADLDAMVVINRGKGNILLRTSDDFGTDDWKRDEGTFNQNNNDNKGINSLDFDLGGACNITIDQSKDGRTHWHADGPASFMSNLSVEEQGSTLVIGLKSFQSHKFFGIGFGNTLSAGTMRISVARPVLKSLNAKIKGASDIRSAIDVEQANVVIAGSGNMILEDITTLRLKVAGSGDCDFGKVEDASINIAGSGDVTIKELLKTGSVRIAGSGDVSILGGEAERLEVSIVGSGDIDAKHLTVDELDIEMMGTGDAVIGRVRGQSVERISRASDLKILHRG